MTFKLAYKGKIFTFEGVLEKEQEKESTPHTPLKENKKKYLPIARARGYLQFLKTKGRTK